MGLMNLIYLRIWNWFVQLTVPSSRKEIKSLYPKKCVDGGAGKVIEICHTLPDRFKKAS
jgi:hypothetical protein